MAVRKTMGMPHVSSKACRVTAPLSYFSHDKETFKQDGGGVGVDLSPDGCLLVVGGRMKCTLPRRALCSNVDCR